MNPNKSTQFELFSGTYDFTGSNAKPLPRFKDLTLSGENIIVVSIVFVMLVLISFCLGVEKGKELVQVPRLIDKNVPAILPLKRQGLPREKMPSPSIYKEEASKNINSQPSKISEAQKNNNAPASVPQLMPRGFTIQVASYKSEKYAAKEANNIKQKDMDIFVLPKGSHQILCVGKFEKKEDALALLSRLKGRYKDCLIRRL